MLKQKPRSSVPKWSRTRTNESGCMVWLVFFFFLRKAVTRPKPAAALAWLWPTARPGDLESQSRLRPSQSRGFQPKPGRHITNHINRVVFVPENATGSTAQVFNRHFCHQVEQGCNNCPAPLETTVHFSDTPKILALNVFDRDVTLSQTIKVMGTSRSTILHLRGLVYHGGFHFTCRIIDPLGKIWFNDGISTGRTSTEDGWLRKISQPNLYTCRNKQLCLAIYAQKWFCRIDGRNVWNSDKSDAQRTSICRAKHRPSTSKYKMLIMHWNHTWIGWI